MSGSIATATGYATFSTGGPVKIEFGTSFLLINTLSKLGIETGKVAKEVVGALVTGVSVIFIVTDIVFLVKDWNTEHPTYDAIIKIIDKLNEELTLIKELFNFFSSDIESF